MGAGVVIYSRGRGNDARQTYGSCMPMAIGEMAGTVRMGTKGAGGNRGVEVKGTTRGT
jgi:hypothetical protein